MTQPVLVSAVGWRADLVTAVVGEVKPRVVELVHSRHPKTRKALEAVRKHLEQHRIPFTSTEVADFDFFAWWRAVEDAWERHSREPVIVNVSAGHGVGIATLSSAAVQHGAEAICYDWEDTKEFHYSSPAALINLGRLRREDHAIIDALAGGPSKVKDLAERASRDSSSVSVSLKRLVEWGFLDRESRGREAFYALRPGVAEFHEGIHES